MRLSPVREFSVIHFWIKQLPPSRHFRWNIWHIFLACIQYLSRFQFPTGNGEHRKIWTKCRLLFIYGRFIASIKPQKKGYSLRYFTFEPRQGDVAQHRKKPEMIRQNKMKWNEMNIHIWINKRLQIRLTAIFQLISIEWMAKLDNTRQEKTRQGKAKQSRSWSVRARNANFICFP